MTHDLKCAECYFEAVADGRKTFELRLNDRGFNAGDELMLREVNERGYYTDRQLRCAVTYVLSGGPWLADGFVAMAITVKGST